jgi:hypothetical protein
MPMTHIDAAAAKAMFPKIVGPILGADLWSGFAILDMGPGAHGVMIAGKFEACCPDYTSAKTFGETHANVAVSKMPKTVIAFALKHKIPVGCVHARDGKSIEYYYTVDKKGNQVEMTRTANPKVCHALAMCRRHLARGV